MIKRFIVGICLLFTAMVFSQQNNSSPYSYYGIGDLKFKGTVENRAMGGLGILPDSIHMNLQNPASYSSLLLTSFTLGSTYSATTLKTDAAESEATRTTLDYLALGIPISRKTALAVGVLPYSSVGYRIENTVVQDDTETFTQFEGEGGLTRVFAGVSYKITPKLSLGADAQYNFGTIETKSITALPSVPVQYPTREINTSDYSGISFNIGAMFQTKINQKYDWFTSATYAPSSKLSSDTERQLATITFAGSSEIIVDEIDVTVGSDDVTLPSKVTLGSGLGLKSKWFVGAEYTFQESNELGNRFDDVTNASFEASHRVSLGGYYTPKYQSFNSYFSKITYRAGLKYEKTGLVLNNESINDYSISLGMGLPLNYFSSNLNLGLELGQRGTTNANLVQENYINVFVSISLNDRWFVKRKYD
ncbi:outer membrane protein transport protein [Flavobacterium litorale]|uniref:Outer membrane protein transport protein n=1 Tax=Flavobacterium litorale TaxID=2856519 RepID=A0ABX8V974_9FLAO|nr:outer membrane protein transport protein [Flavobacterium litorale]QYJ69404.1 outer membrane protein transport protein [Flavobacterium litorale]